MVYRAVGGCGVNNRVAVVIKDLHLPISEEDAVLVLYKKGFMLLKVDMIKCARQCINSSRYRRGARPSEAPGFVDCSSFTKWLYGKRGIWLPRRSIQQSEMGEAVGLKNVIEGHVGIVTAEKTIIHAANSKQHVIETPIDDFVGENKFRCARRYMPKNSKVLTLQTPFMREVETSDDVRWIILQTLPGFSL